jgi:hypothetical protein
MWAIGLLGLLKGGECGGAPFRLLRDSLEGSPLFSLEEEERAVLRSLTSHVEAESDWVGENGDDNKNQNNSADRRSVGVHLLVAIALQSGSLRQWLRVASRLVRLDDGPTMGTPIPMPASANANMNMNMDVSHYVSQLARYERGQEVSLVGIHDALIWSWQHAVKHPSEGGITNTDTNACANANNPTATATATTTGKEQYSGTASNTQAPAAALGQGGRNASVATDGRFLYVLGADDAYGIVQVGTGQRGTRAGVVYGSVALPAPPGSGSGSSSGSSGRSGNNIRESATNLADQGERWMGLRRSLICLGDGRLFVVWLPHANTHVLPPSTIGAGVGCVIQEVLRGSPGKGAVGRKWVLLPPPSVCASSVPANDGDNEQAAGSTDTTDAIDSTGVVLDLATTEDGEYEGDGEGGGRGGGGEDGHGGDGGGAEPLDPRVVYLAAMGFPFHWAQAALDTCHGDVEGAAAYIVTDAAQANFRDSDDLRDCLQMGTILGAHVSVEWAGGEWFKGVVDSYELEERQYQVRYDDGDVRWYSISDAGLCLSEHGPHRIKIIAPGPVAAGAGGGPGVGVGGAARVLERGGGTAAGNPSEVVGRAWSGGSSAPSQSQRSMGSRGGTGGGMGGASFPVAKIAPNGYVDVCSDGTHIYAVRNGAVDVCLSSSFLHMDGRKGKDGGRGGATSRGQRRGAAAGTAGVEQKQEGETGEGGGTGQEEEERKIADTDTNTAIPVVQRWKTLGLPTGWLHMNQNPTLYCTGRQLVQVVSASAELTDAYADHAKPTTAATAAAVAAAAATVGGGGNAGGRGSSGGSAAGAMVAPSAAVSPWEQVADGQGREYYWNHDTNETSWCAPGGVHQSAAVGGCDDGACMARVLSLALLRETCEEEAAKKEEREEDGGETDTTNVHNDATNAHCDAIANAEVATDADVGTVDMFDEFEDHYLPLQKDASGVAMEWRTMSVAVCYDAVVRENGAVQSNHLCNTPILSCLLEYIPQFQFFLSVLLCGYVICVMCLSFVA